MSAQLNQRAIHESALRIAYQAISGVTISDGFRNPANVEQETAKEVDVPGLRPTYDHGRTNMTITSASRYWSHLNITITALGAINRHIAVPSAKNCVELDWISRPTIRHDVVIPPAWVTIRKHPLGHIEPHMGIARALHDPHPVVVVTPISPRPRRSCERDSCSPRRRDVGLHDEKFVY